MTTLPVTLFTVCVLGVTYAALSIAVGVERGRSKISLGLVDASIAIGDEDKASALLIAVRRHGICMTLGLGRSAPNPLRTAGNLMQWSMIVISSALGLILTL